MKYHFNQYYYTAAPDLFDRSRKSGWGIFGSSTPEDDGKNENAEQIAKEWVPMRLLEEEAFPVEYVMYVDDRYVAGGTTSCGSLIKGDHRPNIWTHVLVPEETGTESFLSCLSLESFDKVRRQEEKIVLPPLAVEEKEDDDGLLKSWSSPQTDAALLKELLAGLTGLGKSILFTDETLQEDDFEGYQKLARAMMRRIYHLLPGSLRKELSFITPMVPKYFQLTSDKPKGARFYFGPEDAYDTVLSMQQGYVLSAGSFYDALLQKMMDFYHTDPLLYEEIGNLFGRNSYAIRENDYLWHFLFEMLARSMEIDWSLFGEKEYLDAYNQTWNDAEKQGYFLHITEKLRKENENFRTSPGCFSIFCRMLRVLGDGVDADLMEQTADWMLGAEMLQPQLRKEFLRVLSESGLADNLIYTIKYTVMQKSDGFLEEAQEKLHALTQAQELEKWWKDYEPLKERFQTDLERKLENLFLDGREQKELKELLALDQKILGNKVRTKLRNRILFELQDVSLLDDHAWEMWLQCEGMLKLLDREKYEEKQILWRHEYWKQVEENDILLDPSWRTRVRPIAETLGIDWQEVCDSFAADIVNASQDWGEPEVEASRKIARHLEPSLGALFEEICDDTYTRIVMEKNEKIAQMKASGMQERTEIPEISRTEERTEKGKKEQPAHGGTETMSDHMRLIVSSVFWAVFNLFIYEGIQLADSHIDMMAAIGVWAATIVITLILLAVVIKKGRRLPKMVILLISSFFWTSCAAIMKVMFGLFGEAAYLGALFVVMFILTVTGTDDEK